MALSTDLYRYGVLGGLITHSVAGGMTRANYGHPLMSLLQPKLISKGPLKELSGFKTMS